MISRVTPSPCQFLSAPSNGNRSVEDAPCKILLQPAQDLQTPLITMITALGDDKSRPLVPPLLHTGPSFPIPCSPDPRVPKSLTEDTREQHLSCPFPSVQGSGLPQQSLQAAWGNVTNSSCRDPRAQIAPRCFFNDFQRFQPGLSQERRSSSKSQRGDGDRGLSGLLCVTLAVVGCGDT